MLSGYKALGMAEGCFFVFWFVYLFECLLVGFVEGRTPNVSYTWVALNI